MRHLAFCLFLLVTCYGVPGQSRSSPPHPVVFFQDGFPTIESEVLSREALGAAIPDATFADVNQMRSEHALSDASLLILPYGSAVPIAAWSSIEGFLQKGGNLLIVGGQALHVPVSGDRQGAFKVMPPQDSYSRQIGFLHTYAVPLSAQPLRFAWRTGYQFLPKLALDPKAVFVEEGHLNGLGYLDAPDGAHMASPIIVSDHLGTERFEGARIVALPFIAKPGYWRSQDGQNLLRTAAQYAEAGATSLTLELQYTALRPGETPIATVHVHQHARQESAGTVTVDMLEGDHLIETHQLTLKGDPSIPVLLGKPLQAGLYTLRATWNPSPERLGAREFTENGFVVEDLSSLETGPALGAHDDFLTLGGAPFLPVGTNYFSTDANGWDFSGPRNGTTWERDFADMERHNVNFVRTGVWMPSLGKFVEPLTGEANERFLRNLEAFLSAAHRHHIVVNFTCFAFTPHGQDHSRRSSDRSTEPPPPNPYLDATTLEQERSYITSVVRRFRHLPWLSYDLINEPSFSNPRNIFHGNVPNDDPAERTAWHLWLTTRYGDLSKLAEAWRVTPEELVSFDSIPLPEAADLTFDRYGNQHEVRAFDYNLFAQDMFSGWVRGMVSAIHATGSSQLINVGQDEGGVTNRVLNQFYANTGVSFTTNHTYWADDALLWDSVVAKRPGLPNITGETGYQPAWNPDGTWRYDERTGTALEERKWALGFAAGSSGAVQWDWDREVDFGMQRSDGSAKVWEDMMRDLGGFARAAAPYATGLVLPETAIVLPQSLQLSVYGPQALAAQQAAVRVLYQHNRVEAYAVGEFQLDTLRTPKLIILPSAMGFSDHAWTQLEAHVRAGATLLVSGPFSADEHLHATQRAEEVGIHGSLEELLLRQAGLALPSETLPLTYSGLKTSMLDYVVLPSEVSWKEVTLGKGKLLFSAYPLELNDNDHATAAAYSLAIKSAGVRPTYTTSLTDPGILISPTRLPHATLYVLTSETSTKQVVFTDLRSGKNFSGVLEAGRAALLLIGEKGNLLATYHWPASPSSGSQAGQDRTQSNE